MSVASIVGRNNYRLGDSGEAVRTIQLALRDLGFGLKGSGYFGNATDTAVSAFQKRVGLMADGVVGPVTAKALDEIKVLGRADDRSLIVEATMPLWYQAGLATLGTKEAPGSRDNADIIEWAHDEGGMIAREYTHDSIPWCALWANHILTKASLKGTETLWALDFNADDMERRTGRRWPAVRLNGPVVGAFAPMLRDGGGHITVVAGKDQHGNIMGMGGNQSDAVTIAAFAPSRLNKGMWWPAGVPVPALQGMQYLPIVRSDGRISTAEA